MAACLWRILPARRIDSRDLVNDKLVSRHIANRFFSELTKVALSSQIKNTAGNTFIAGVSAYLQADTATVEIAPEADGSNAYRAVIKMSGQVFIRGWSTDLNAGTATVVVTPSTPFCQFKNITTWVSLFMLGNCSTPATPKVYKNPSLWRRCLGDRLQHNNLIHPRIRTSELHLKGIGEGFFELSEYGGSDIHVHLTPSADAVVVIPAEVVETHVHLSAEVDTWFNGLIESNIYPCPIVPTIKRYALTTLTSEMSSATIQMEMADKMMRASFVSEDKKLADFDEIIFTMPDYNGDQQTVFVGFVPSSNSTYSAANDKTELVAYDYAWYLTMQYPSEADAALLSFDQQYNTLAWELNYMGNDNPYLNFYEGDLIIGQLSGHSGKVFSVTRTGGSGNGKLILTNVTGTPYYDINDDPYYFWWGDDGDGGGIHGEQLYVNGQAIAWNNGHTTETVFQYGETERILYPHEWIRRLLGGDNWQRVTGIYPYRLTTVGNWAALGKSFTFDEKTTKIKAIEEVCKYLDYLFFVKWKTIYGVVRPCAYFIPMSSIDSETVGLDLPSMVSFTKSTDKYIVEPIEREIKGDEKYNKVTVKCIGWASEWYTCTKQTNDCAAGLEKPIEYVEICDFADDQTSCDARANALFYYYQNPIQKWNVTILDHPAIELYQKLAFYGFTDQIDSVPMRVVGISHTISDGGLINETKVTVIPDSQFAAYLSVSRIFTGIISETEAVANSVVDARGGIETGVVIAINPDGSVVVKNDRGLTTLARDAS